MKDMRSWSVLHASGGMAVALSLFSISACRLAQSHSAIVDKIRDAGAGDVVTASEPAIEDWLRKHADVATQVNGMCDPVRRAANAQWGDTTEGKVCLAARNVAMGTYRSPRDAKGYHPNQ